jgi:hypothetical protein
MVHSDNIPKLGRFPLTVDPLVGMTRLTKALVDGGTGLNLMYLDTFEGMGLTHGQLQSHPHPFDGVVPSEQSVLLRWVTLSVTFGDVSNYCSKILTFDVVDFSGPYHVILGWPCYVKFMAIPNYAYLKLKITGPTGDITVEAKTQRALDYEQDSLKPSAFAVITTELRELSLRVPSVPLSLAMPPIFSAFKVAEDA